MEWHKTRQGKTEIANAKKQMADHDALPPRLRQYLSEYPEHVSITPETVARVGVDAVIEALENRR